MFCSHLRHWWLILAYEIYSSTAFIPTSPCSGVSTNFLHPNSLHRESTVEKRTPCVVRSPNSHHRSIRPSRSQSAEFPAATNQSVELPSEPASPVEPSKLHVIWFNVASATRHGSHSHLVQILENRFSQRPKQDDYSQVQD